MTNGAEQPQWDPDTGRFYLSIPEIGLNPSSGGVVPINPATHKIDKTFAMVSTRTLFRDKASMKKKRSN